MSNMLILRPATPAAVAVNRGSGGQNLLTPDPKEVWADNATGSDATVTLDFGAARAVDSAFVGYHNAIAGAAWSLAGGLNAAGDLGLLVAGADLRAPSSSGAPPRRHAFRRFAATNLRFLTFYFNQPAAPALQIGVLLSGLAFQPAWNREWGGGRQVLDTGSKEPLLGGGFGVGDGARKAAYKWRLGDLSDAEADALYDMALDRGETRPVLVVEDPDLTAGLNERLHYGLFDRFEQIERRTQQQTSWSLSVTQWV
jgi:hypothetical protein